MRFLNRIILCLETKVKVKNLLVICSINKYSNITMMINNINYFNNWDCLIYTRETPYLIIVL